MLIRRETAADAAATAAVTAAAFAAHVPADPPPGTEPIEVALLDRLREDAGWTPEYSLVAVTAPGSAAAAPADSAGSAPAGSAPDGAVVGHVVCTRGSVGGAAALGLGPISVAPAHQGRGIGTALMHAVLGAAEARSEPLVALLGEPAFYGRFGFRPAAEHGIAAPDPAWGDYFQVRLLSAHTPAHRGAFRYAAPFDSLSA
ncbi:N-acetyltransferase [Streptomonospora sp. PA3]|uniref:GNAT family N-acetyltransferase n=1 Tax=Streptomonospora sp. PA3 TaxID=2607326 RepID=UPI0012DD3EED|nr:N-acetyltransferase [Streptomonospora sp. PA3]MUL43535.1 N-acetyltransferase [Streptomonospora sp. PA3]